MPHVLPPLPYDYSALAPLYSPRNVELHHSKHHQAYVTNLNNALDKVGGEIAGLSLDALLKRLPDVPDAQRTVVRNNAGGIYNHNLFWSVLAPGGKGSPSPQLAAALEASFGGTEAFVQKFSQAAMGVFGSGWTFLTAGPSGLLIQNYPGHDGPLMDGSGHPIAVLDMWEHAYYLTVENRKAEFVDSFFKLLNWDTINERFGAR